jgi:hypothetical protein
MEAIVIVGGMIIGVGIAVGVPLSMLRSLDEIKASQRRLESRLAELEARLAGHDRVG